jgi:hypothetical protein
VEERDLNREALASSFNVKAGIFRKVADPLSADAVRSSRRSRCVCVVSFAQVLAVETHPDPPLPVNLSSTVSSDDVERPVVILG